MRCPPGPWCVEAPEWDRGESAQVGGEESGGAVGSGRGLAALAGKHGAKLAVLPTQA